MNRDIDQTYLYELFSNDSFNEAQKVEILRGIEHGLSKRKISVFANSEFTDYQMLNIRKGSKII